MFICAFLVAASPAGREAPSPGIWRGAAPFKLWDSSLLASGGPPVGGVYKAVLRMPVIGDQTFVLQILRRRRSLGPAGITERGLARITLSGAMNLDEHAEFRMGADGAILLDFNAPTLALLRRMRTRRRSSSASATAAAACRHACPRASLGASESAPTAKPATFRRWSSRLRWCQRFACACSDSPVGRTLRRDADDVRSNHFKHR
mmetsp:Transcript_22984/g.68118  ORF Transcript_22984/g.68118 Transcript_22984/m.68118 type:complete len:205 (+) Transcript_22984:29-643(+)